MVKVFVPQDYLNKINQTNSSNWPKPSEFWLHRPDSWMAKDLAMITVDGATWAKWNAPIRDSKDISAGKQLLKD